MSKQKPLVKCIKCGWVSMGVSQAYAEAEIDSFMAYYNALPENKKDFWRGVGDNGELKPFQPPALEDYKCCASPAFRLALPEELPYGSTINPVIIPESLKP